MSKNSTDPIADFLTQIRNAILVGKTEIRLPASQIKRTIAEKLQQNKYLANVTTEQAKPNNFLVVTINQPGENSTITEIKRVSKPGRRVYVKANEIPKVKNGRGLVLVSTSKGIMTGFEASQEKLGGELLLEVY